MNGSEKQIAWAEKIVSDFIAKCAEIKSSMNARIEKYNARQIKTGRDFSDNIADTIAEIESVDKSVELIKAASDAHKIIDLRDILEKANENSSWDKNGLYNLYLIVK